MEMPPQIPLNRSGKKRKLHHLKCPECNKVFQRAFTFERHYSTIHQSQSGQYSCESCDKLFVRKDSLVSHRKACEKGKTKDKCPICDFTASKAALREHYQNDHGFSIEEQVIECSNVEDFHNWKNQYEKENVAKYIKITTYARSDQSKVTFYSCHRNGYCKGEGPRIRRSKIQGSNKICGWCPSEMKVTYHKEGKVKASYFSTHVGHGQDIERIPLTKEEKDQIAERLAAKVPATRILSDVQCSVAKSDQLNRIHVLSRQDLENIKLAYKIKENTKKELITNTSEQKTSIDNKWIDSVIKFKKESGSLSELYPQIASDDAVLIIMSDSQKQLLQTSSQRCVCIDSVCNKMLFNLVTLNILNDNQTIPCAFLYTNSVNAVNLNVFFRVVRNNVQIIEANIFLSDLNDLHYNVWCDVMSPPKYRLYCSLYVWRAWRKRLVMTCFKEDYKKIVDGNLRIILEETDADKFQTNLTKFIADLYNNEYTENFAVFFESLFTNNCEMWAYCFRNHDAIAIDTQLERVNTSLEYLIKQDKDDNHIQNVIVSITKFLHFTIAEWIGIKDAKYKDLKLLNIRKTHRVALGLDMEVQELYGKWYVKNKSKRYRINTASIQCECDIRCEGCTACIHMFYCTCVDSRFRWNMCKHIHYFCSKALSESQDSNAEDISETAPKEEPFPKCEIAKSSSASDNHVDSVTADNGDKTCNNEDFHENIVDGEVTDDIGSYQSDTNSELDFQGDQPGNNYSAEQMEALEDSEHCLLDIGDRTNNEINLNYEIKNNNIKIFTECENHSSSTLTSLELHKESLFKYFNEILPDVTNERQIEYIKQALFNIKARLKKD